MGIAAYNRGSIVIARRCRIERNPAFDIMDRINALPKLFPPNAMRKPFGPVVIEHDPHRRVWWLLCERKMYTGYSYYYPTLALTVQNWDIYLNGYDETHNRWSTSIRYGYCK